MKRMCLFAIAPLAVPTQIAAQVGVFCRTPAGDYPAPETAAIGATCIFRDANGLARYGRYIRLPDDAPPPPPLFRPTVLPQAGIAGANRILDTGYERLREVGGEQKGYGLYSYVLIPAASPASAALLNEIFKVIPHIRSTGALPLQLNILHIPFQNGKDADFAKARATSSTVGVTYLDAFYDYPMARAILNNLCNPPATKIVKLCHSDLSRGPFIFTYAEPASKLAPVAPPYLLVDLREVHPRAFAEFVSAFQAQVKSEDVNGGARLNTLRLKILNIVLTAADWTAPVPKAVADIAHSVTASPSQKNIKQKLR
jgi:hypothetical protein